MKAVLYDITTGKIASIMEAPTEVIEATASVTGKEIFVGEGNHMTQYVVGGEVVDRPTNPARVEGLAIVDLPVPSTVILSDVEYEVTDGTAEFEFNLPGTYSVTVKSWPYLDQELQIENPAQ